MIRIDDFDNRRDFANNAINAALALPRSGAALMRTRRYSPRQSTIALLDEPAVTLTAMRVMQESCFDSSITRDYAVELIGEGLAIAMVERSLATRINATAA